MAKRKADELEDFNSGQIIASFLHLCLAHLDFLERDELEAGLSPDVIEEGTRIVEQLLTTWASRTSPGVQDGEDVVMEEDSDASAEIQLAELKACVEEFRPQVEGNLWVQRLLASLA